MTLSRKRPLPSHTWPQGIDAGPPQTCETCQAEWAEGFDDPPPWKCRRSELQSSGSALQRSGGGLKRTPIRSVSETNSGRAHQKDERFRAYTRRSPSILSGRSPCDPAHVYSWGAGYGDWLSDGTGDLVPLTREEHTELHRIGRKTFEARHGVDLDEARIKHGERYGEDGGE